MLLAVGLVTFTTALVAAVAHYYVGLPWASAFVLGAIVSPPDAVSAMAATRGMKLPRIVRSIIEGESLVNDASALVLYRVMVAWVVGGSIDGAAAVGSFIVIGGGGVLLGLLGGWLVAGLHKWIDRAGMAEAKLTITTTLLTPYVLYVVAEHLHVSGVLAVVAAGLWVGHRAERIFCPEVFAEARAVWEWVEFVLNSAVFMLIGFQLPVVLAELDADYSMGELFGFAAAVTLATVAARLIWMFPGAYLPRLADRKIYGTHEPLPPWTHVLVVAWTGMRGVVSIATALALPLTLADGKTPFPGRRMILFLTFWVIFATLVGQGLTLPWLIRKLRVTGEAEAHAESAESLPE